METFFDAARRFFLDTVEVRQWGLNSIIVSAFATAVFTLLEGWGLWQQARTIRTRRSGESVSVTWFSFCQFVFPAYALYGMHVRGLAVIFDGTIQALMTLPVMIGLLRFKPLTRREKWQLPIFALMVPAMAFLPWKNTVFLVMTTGFILSSAQQPLELWKRRKTGAVDPKLLAVMLLTMGFWAVYAFCIRAWALMITTGLNGGLIAMAIALWFKFRAAERPNASSR